MTIVELGPADSELVELELIDPPVILIPVDVVTDGVVLVSLIVPVLEATNGGLDE